MNHEPADEFYIGYRKQAPRGIAARAKLSVAALFVLFASVAAGLSMSMGAFSTAVFEYGREREFTGRLHALPYPSLDVARPGTIAGQPTSSSYLLVAFGKHGAAEAVSAFDGRLVRLRGTLIYHDECTMIELVDGSLATLDEASSSPIPGTALATAGAMTDIELGEKTLVGEIVDSKCFLGVMKPGHLKPHRACATNCIRGGIPPILLVRSPQGDTALHYLLVDKSGGAVNERILDRIAEPVRVRGRVVKRGELLFLYSDPRTIERVE